ncbi:MAG: hypothetical protein JO131_02790, partial [Gammaproteobacteria bacterium]|nr:hypothetical protein [Gammaproteobacteria bacterium]
MDSKSARTILVSSKNSENLNDELNDDFDDIECVKEDTDELRKSQLKDLVKNNEFDAASKMLSTFFTGNSEKTANDLFFFLIYENRLIPQSYHFFLQIFKMLKFDSQICFATLFLASLKKMSSEEKNVNANVF